MNWVDGATYKGSWNQGQQDGIGIITKDGNKNAGFFKDNVFVKPLQSKEEFIEYQKTCQDPLPDNFVDEIFEYCGLNE